MEIDIKIILDDSVANLESSEMIHEIITKSLALKVATGHFFDSNFNLPVNRVGDWSIESGLIRRVGLV